MEQMINQEEKEKVMAIVHEYGVTFNKMQSIKNQMEKLKDTVSETENELNAIREKENILILKLREKYGEDIITADYLFNELKK